MGQYFFENDSQPEFNKLFKIFQKYNFDFSILSRFYLIDSDDVDSSEFDGDQHVYAGIKLSDNNTSKEFWVSQCTLMQEERFIKCLIAHEFGHQESDYFLSERNLDLEIAADKNIVKLFGHNDVIYFLEKLLQLSWNGAREEVNERLDYFRINP